MQTLFSNYSKQFKGLAVSTVVIVITFSYQNCSPPAPPTPEGGYTSSSTSGANPADDFAYEVSADTFAYMSCAHSSLSDAQNNDADIFTFKLGSYTDTSGLRFTNSFYNKTAHYSDSRFQEKMNQDSLNGPAVLQMSLRKKLDLSKYADGASQVIYPLRRLLGHSSIAGELIKRPAGSTMNYFKKISSLSGRHMHSALRGVHKSSSQKRDLMSYLQNSSMLVLSFADATQGDESSMPLIKVSANDEDTYLGVGFNISESSRKVESFSEYNLSTMTKTRQWNCPASKKFMIVSNLDYRRAVNDTSSNDTICPVLSDKEQILKNPSIADSLNRVRQILDPTHSVWAINMEENCIVPKRAVGCYPSEAQQGTEANKNEITVKYSNPSGCSETRNDCPQYLTVCTR